MMYNEKFAVAIKADGKVLREFEDKVYIPFGAEYSIFLKNLNTVRAMVRISIDGEDIAGGSSFVVQPNGSVDIERYLRSNNYQGNRFKFIERTGAVEDHRGVGVEDGLVRIEYQFERPRPTHDLENILRQRRISDGVYPQWSSHVNYSSDTIPVSASAVNDAGITVEGSLSDQQFSTVSGFPVEAQKHVMVVKLLGKTEDSPVVEPVTVKTKPKCKTCGKTNSPTAKFCAECGTSLQIVA